MQKEIPGKVFHYNCSIQFLTVKKNFHVCLLYTSQELEDDVILTSK